MTATANEPARVIGELLPDPRFPASVRILSRGRVLLTVPREVAESERLVAGMPLSEALYGRLCRAADEEAAFRTVVRKLSARPFAVQDLVRRLVLKGHPPGAAAAAAERARRTGLLDDERFTRQYIETRTARGRGPLRLRRELAAMGVDRTVIDRALAESLGREDDEAVRVERLIRKRIGELRGVARPALRRRLLAFLARRGFVGRSARDAVDRATGFPAA